MDVTCPYGEVCRNGGCVDPCLGITCDDGYSCVLGVCRSCACSSCDGGQVCHENVCVDAGCESQTCMVGTHCAGGSCIDDCAGTQCPGGQLCQLGTCIADPDAGAGGSGEGGDATGGIVIEIPDPSTGGSSGSGEGNGAGKQHAGSDALGAGDKNSIEAKGCSCGIPGQRRTSRLGWGLALLGLWAARRRRPQR
jgi:hypothetical protein